MKKASPDDLQHIAKLAHLRIHPKEMDERVKEFNSILSYIDLLNELDTTSTAPSLGSEDSKVGTPLVPDETKKTIELDAVFKNAPDKQEHFFKVPRILGED